MFGALRNIVMAGNSITAKVETIHPKVALGYLENNQATNYRPRRPHVVARYAKDMKAGRWQLNGEAIKFNGRDILDGQHRLAAIVEAGVPIATMVVRGLRPDAVFTMDEGNRRNMADRLRYEGLDRNQSLMAALVSSAFQYEMGHWSWQCGIVHMTHSEQVDYYRQHKARLSEALEVTRPLAAKHVRTIRVPVATVGFFGAHPSPVKSPLLESFTQSLASGVGIDPDDPILHLRQLVLTANRSSIRVDMKRAWAVRAWNKAVEGKRGKLLLPKDKSRWFNDIKHEKDYIDYRT